ncbi:conserved hypothethical protein (plasmid) [Ralstonia solanacearum CMR15]|nr:conserved hypothethical protein [Ralstonia solanacearum CMR15]
MPLNSARWTELDHAYGKAHDTPTLLAQLEELPSSLDGAEPWHSLWSALAHQGDVYPASFAAVPHVVRTLATAPSKADFSYFQFPTVVEISRQQKDILVPDDLRTDYFAALAALPRLVAVAADKDWDGGFLSCALAAIAAAKGYGAVAEAALELSPDVAPEFLDWFYER